MNRKQIAIVSVLAATALVASAAFLIYDRAKGKRNVYKAIANDIFRDYNSKAIIVDDFWTHQYTEKMIFVAKGIASEQEKRILIEECVNRILNVRFQAENLCATTMALRNFQMGMLFFCWALQAMDVDSGFLFDIIMQWVERSRTGFMAVLDMPYDTKDYKAWRDKINAVAGVRSEHPSLILSVRENLFNRYLPNVKGEDRLKYQKAMDEYCEKIKSDKKVIEDCLEQLRRKSPEVRILKFNIEKDRDKK